MIVFIFIFCETHLVICSFFCFLLLLCCLFLAVRVNMWVFSVGGSLAELENYKEQYVQLIIPVLNGY